MVIFYSLVPEIPPMPAMKPYSVTHARKESGFFVQYGAFAYLKNNCFS